MPKLISGWVIVARSSRADACVKEGKEGFFFCYVLGMGGNVDQVLSFLQNTFLSIAIRRLNPRSTFFIRHHIIVGVFVVVGLLWPDTMLLQKKINKTKTNFRGIADSFVRIYNTLLYTFQSEYLLLINRGPPVIY